MIVTSVQIKTVKMQKHLCSPVFTKSSETERFRGFFIPFQPFSLSIAIQILLGLEYNNQIKLAKDNPQK